MPLTQEQLQLAEDLEDLMTEAEKRGDMQTAKAALIKMEGLYKEVESSYSNLAADVAPPQQASISGQFEGLPVAEPFDVFGRQKATPETEALPELKDSGLLSGEDQAKVAALSPVLLATTNPDEAVKIIASNFPEIAVTYNKDAQGGVFPVLTNRKTGAVTQVNRPGLSGMDIMQTIGLGAAFTPAARAAGVLGATAKSAATQVAIEGSQVAGGGEFNPLDVAIAAGGAGLFKGGEKLIKSTALRHQQIIDEGGLPTPAFKKALDKRDIDVGAIVYEDLPLVSSGKPLDQIVDDVIKNQLQRGGTSGSLYKYQVGPRGNIIDDAFGEEALKQGFQKGDIASAKTANVQTKAELKKILNMKRAIQDNPSLSIDMRPTNIIGQRAMVPFNYLRDEAKRLRRELDIIAKKEFEIDSRLLESDATGGLLKGREINPRKVQDIYFNQLDDLGVTVDTINGKPKLNFDNSLISEDRTSQRIIKSVTNILSKDGAVDASIAHNLKRQLDTMLDFNKKSVSGLTDAGKDFAMQIRRGINDSIRDVSPRYARVNDDMSRILTIFDDFDSALGGGVDPFAKNATNQVGTTLRRLLTDVQSRENLLDSVVNLDKIAREMGANLPVDLKRLITFNRALDGRFGATSKGGFQGSIEAARGSGDVEAIKRFAQKTMLEKGFDIGSVGIQKTKEAMGATKIDESNAFDAMTRILNRK